MAAIISVDNALIFKRKNMEYMSERHSPHLTYDKLANNQNLTACKAPFWINLHQTR